MKTSLARVCNQKTGCELQVKSLRVSLLSPLHTSDSVSTQRFQIFVIFFLEGLLQTRWLQYNADEPPCSPTIAGSENLHFFFFFYQTGK